MSNKTKQKQKAKVVEDLTFGLKNKNKSKVVQKYCKEVSNRVMYSDVKGGAKAVEEANRQKKAAKAEKEAEDEFLKDLFKQVQGVATAGAEGYEDEDYKKKESNINLYEDPRTPLGKAPDTIITCQHFVKAVEKDLYGFNWVCPGGGDNCGYMHRLPMGYVLIRDKDKKKDDESEGEVLTLEEKIEEERRALPSEGLTPVTLESFKKWKEEKAKKK